MVAFSQGACVYVLVPFVGSLQGRGVAQSDVEAAAWYRQAAAQGLADAQFNLGNLHHKGRDEAEAVRWFRAAAEQGHLAAEYNLGVLFE